MESTKQRQCPHCYSYDVVPTGSRANTGGEMSFSDFFGLPNFPIYKCNKCYRQFIYQNKNPRENWRDSDDSSGGMPY